MSAYARLETITISIGKGARGEFWHFLFPVSSNCTGSSQLLVLPHSLRYHMLNLNFTQSMFWSSKLSVLVSIILDCANFHPFKTLKSILEIYLKSR